jgi:threonine 3-dehydrogenase
MTLLITGGTGFIGSEVTRILLERGEKKPVLFDINPSTKRLGDYVKQVKFVRGDLGNFSQVLDVVNEYAPDVIYHLGGMLSVSSEANPSAAFKTNVLGIFHILEAARLFGVKQVLFTSTTATYGYDISGDVLNDYTLQRPTLFYGITKVFSEHLGLFYSRKYGIDFRSVRYPSIVGPGVKTPGVVQYTSWMIEECAKGKPFTIWVKPETKCPIMYYKDAARAIVELGEAQNKNIKTINYILAGITPTPTARELSDIVKEKVPNAKIHFKPDFELMRMIEKLSLPIDDNNAKKEWGWKIKYDKEKMINDFLKELEQNPQRYN